MAGIEIATLQHVREIVCQPMTNLYFPKAGVDDVDEALADYAEALEGYPVTALRRGWRDVVKNYEHSFWPSIAIIKQAVEQFGTHKDHVPDVGKLRARTNADIEHEWARAGFNFLRTPRGREFCNQGLAAPVVDFVVKHERLPLTEADELEIVSARKTFLEKRAEVEAMIEAGAGGLWPNVLALSNAMLERNDILAREADKLPTIAEVFVPTTHQDRREWQGWQEGQVLEAMAEWKHRGQFPMNADVVTRREATARLEGLR